MIYHSETNPLRWSSFRLKYKNCGLVFNISVLVHTKSLSNVRLSEERLYRLNLIKSLSDMGLTTVEISDALNIRQIKTPKGLQYTPKIVWVTLKKYLKRLDREKHLEIIDLSETVGVFPLFSDMDS